MDSDTPTGDATPPALPLFEDGNYVAIMSLGGGGQGRVVVARDQSLQRSVAIKILHRNLVDREDFERRFRREGQVLGQLSQDGQSHVPHVIGKTSTVPDGAPCLVMEFVEGLSLRESMDIVDPHRAVTIAAVIADALARAHAEQFVHRDVKPDNIILRKATKSPVLVDWGLAKVGDSRFDTETDQAGISDNRALGTYGYMSPEQARGQPATEKCDIFALGCVLFETLTGHMAFPNGGRVTDSFDAEPEYGRVPSGVPDDVLDVLYAALVIEANERTMTAAQMAKRLHEAAKRTRGPARLVRLDVDRADPFFIKGKSPSILVWNEEEDKFIPGARGDTRRSATVHLVPFESTYRKKIIDRLKNEEIQRANAEFDVRVYLPRLTRDTSRFDRVVIMLNGLAESSSKIFDEIGMPLAEDGTPAVLLPLPRHLSRFVHTEPHTDPFRPGEPYEKLYSQQILQSVQAHPELVCNAYQQIRADLLGLHDLLVNRKGLFQGFMAENARVSLLGYSIGGLYSLASTIHELEMHTQAIAEDARLASRMSPGERERVLGELPFSCVYLLESGLPIDQIDTGRLYLRHDGISTLLGEEYVYGKRAKHHRGFVGIGVEKLFSDRELAMGKGEAFDKEVARHNKARVAAGKRKSLFARSQTEAESIWEEIVLDIHDRSSRLDEDERQSFRSVFLGENPIKLKSQLDFLSRHILVITGGEDEIFPAQKLLAGPARGLATLQVPGLSHWLKGRSTLGHWKHWSGLIVELMKDFESTAVGNLAAENR